MPALARAGDSTTGHETYPPTTVVGGSSKVTAEGVGVLSKDNLIHVTHCNTVDPYDCHAGSAATYSDKVFIEGSPAIRIGDTITCGDTVAGGAGKVISA
ncbi:PAAR motif protein [Vibrio phage 1.081.O._10N.286.52.C2]|nr:PAAR motif protein [Vibrio phage 1.081.O._10N.286.52.C2]